MSVTVDERVVEVEGISYLCSERTTVVPADGAFREVREYSFDRGATWFETRVAAFVDAEREKKLVRVGDVVTEAGAFEGFMLALVEEIQGLEPGETLKVVRTETEFAVVREHVVLATRASDVQEVNLRMEGEDGNPQGKGRAGLPG